MCKKNQYVICWLNISIYILILMVVIGGITRLTNSGLSITVWKPITGIIPPMNEEDWMKEFDTYKKYPEYKKINYNMELKEYKKIYFWEYLHRMLGRFIGILFIIPFTFFYFKNYIKKRFTFNFIFLFILGSLQAIAGWMMVESGLVNDPSVSHYRLAIHLILAFLIIGYTYWTKLLLINNNLNKIKNFQYYNSFLNFIFIIFFIQILYGAFTAGLSKEGLWNTFPLIDGAYVPSGIFVMEPTILNFITNSRTILFLHPYIGISLMFLIYLFCYQIYKDNLDVNCQYLVVIIFIQIMLGMLTLISDSSILLALLHQVSAILLMLILLKIKHLLKYLKTS